MQETVLAIWKTVTKSLFSKSACKMYPVQEPVFFERTRGHIEMQASKCIVCTMCAKRCPTGAIEVDREANTWQINRFKCILCGACTEGCKPGALSMVNHYAGPTLMKQFERLSVTPPKPRPKKTDQTSPEPAE